MTTTHAPRPKRRITLDDLTRPERASVLAEALHIPLAELTAAGAPAISERLLLSPIRGTFRTPWRLLAAVYGVGHAGGPATTRGQIIARVGLAHHKCSFNRLAEAASFFHITLPDTCKDGAARGLSVLRDTDRLRATAVGARAIKDVVVAVGLSPCGSTNAAVRGALAAASIADPTWRVGPQPGRRPKNKKPARTGPFRNAGMVWTEVDDETLVELTAAGTGVDKISAQLGRTAWGTGFRIAKLQLIDEPERACARCGGTLPPRTGPGRQAVFCTDHCRYVAAQAREAADLVARNAELQRPCTNCGVHIEPSARVRRFCSKSCAKKFGYQARVTAVA